MAEPSITLKGWLSVDNEYDGHGEYAGTSIELYSDGRDLGSWIDVVEKLRDYDGQHITITITKEPA